jgi:hypothetical protein
MRTSSDLKWKSHYDYKISSTCLNSEKKPLTLQKHTLISILDVKSQTLLCPVRFFVEGLLCDRYSTNSVTGKPLVKQQSMNLFLQHCKVDEIHVYRLWNHPIILSLFREHFIPSHHYSPLHLISLKDAYSMLQFDSAENSEKDYILQWCKKELEFFDSATKEEEKKETIAKAPLLRVQEQNFYDNFTFLSDTVSVADSMDSMRCHEELNDYDATVAVNHMTQYYEEEEEDQQSFSLLSESIPAQNYKFSNDCVFASSEDDTVDFDGSSVMPCCDSEQSEDDEERRSKIHTYDDFETAIVNSFLA